MVAEAGEVVSAAARAAVKNAYFISPPLVRVKVAA